MVHALEKIHGLLAPGGFLIDLHPTPDLPRIDIRIGQQEFLIGWLRETNERLEYEQAEDAMFQSRENGWFVIERSEDFVYDLYADSVSELVCYLDETWSDAITDDPIFQRAEELMHSAEVDQEIGLHETVRISRLSPIANQAKLE